MKIEMIVVPETKRKFFAIRYNSIFGNKYIMYVIHYKNYKLSPKVNRQRFDKIGRENGIFEGVIK